MNLAVTSLFLKKVGEVFGILPVVLNSGLVMTLVLLGLEGAASNPAFLGLPLHLQRAPNCFKNKPEVWRVSVVTLCVFSSAN